MLRQAARKAGPVTQAMIVAAFLVGCASEAPLKRMESPGPAASSSPAVSTFGERVASIAAGQIGVPYRYGGTSAATGFDCSGLVHYAYARAGANVPRTTAGLWQGLRPVAYSELRPG
ncbi:MAG: C40 family peptidase, partial [Woeseiaceae bacterium]